MEITIHKYDKCGADCSKYNARVMRSSLGADALRGRRCQVRYVTYYYSFLSGLTDVTVHPDKESAVRFYRMEAKHYFDVRLPSKTETPTACGFAHRRFGVMSIRLFRKNFPEWKGGAK